MAIRSLNQFQPLRKLAIRARLFWLRRKVGIRFDDSVSVSMSSRFISGKRGSIAIGSETMITFKTLICSRDATDGAVKPVRIGRRCFIGGGSVILPGITIGDESIVGAGAVVFHDVPPRTVVGGNPARVLRQDIQVGPFGRLEGADDNSRRLWRE